MKSWLTQTATGLLTLASVMLASCEKDETKVTLNKIADPQLTASATTATITPATASSPAVTYTWTPADYGFKAAVTYTLQLAKQGTNFAAPQEFNMGTALTKSFTVSELNGVYNAMDCNIVAGVAIPLDVRVKAVVGDRVDPSYSAVSAIRATPYQAQTPPTNTWAIIGAATPGGWNTETPMTYNYCSRTWSVRLALTAGEFKFRANNDWAINLGDEGTGSATGAGRKLVYNVAPTPNPPNIALSTAGTYTVTLDINATPNPIFTIRP